MRLHRLVAASFLALSLASLADTAQLPPPAPAATTPLSVFRSIKEDPGAVAFSPDGRHLLSASGFELLLWDIPSAKTLRRLEIPGMFRDITACAFSPDGKTILAGSNDGKVATWETETGKLLKVLRSEDWMYGSATSLDHPTHSTITSTAPRSARMESGWSPVRWTKASASATGSPGIWCCAFFPDPVMPRAWKPSHSARTDGSFSRGRTMARSRFGISSNCSIPAEIRDSQSRICRDTRTNRVTRP